MAVSEQEIVASIEGLLAARRDGATICPSEVARELWPTTTWREHMDDVRAVAFSLADDGALEVTQGGKVVDGRSARGPLRLRLPG